MESFLGTFNNKKEISIFIWGRTLQTAGCSLLMKLCCCWERSYSLCPQRLKNWELRERKKARDYAKDMEREGERRRETVRGRLVCSTEKLNIVNHSETQNFILAQCNTIACVNLIAIIYCYNATHFNILPYIKLHKIFQKKHSCVFR